jgi:hypothetical protein
MKLQEDSIPPEYWEDRDWAWDHYAEFVKEYPDQWIAVCHKEVVAHGESIDEIEKIAREKTKMTHFPVIFVEGRIHVYKN